MNVVSALPYQCFAAAAAILIARVVPLISMASVVQGLQCQIWKV